MLNTISSNVLQKYKTSLAEELDIKNGLIGEVSAQIEELIEKKNKLTAEAESLKNNIASLNTDLSVNSKDV